MQTLKELNTYTASCLAFIPFNFTFSPNAQTSLKCAKTNRTDDKTPLFMCLISYLASINTYIGCEIQTVLKLYSDSWI